MAAQASQAELNRFVKVVDEFKANMNRLNSTATKTRVYSSNDPALIREYELAVVRGNALQTTINSAVGAWAVFKRGYRAVTDVTSTAIGDAIDEIRSWFGYDPAPGIGCYGVSQLGSQLGALGAVQIPAAAAIAAIVSAAVLLNSLMNKIFIKIEATNIQEANPNISRGQALAQAEAGIRGPGILGGSVTPVMLGVGALALWLIFSQKK